ncbi:MAG: molybdopterin-dependent oxidoreductase [Actinomycetota bacterium]
MTATVEPHERHVVGACPLDCPDGCSWVVTVRDDVPVKLRGNPKHPFTDGGLCRKVYPWLDYAVDPNRLMTPLRRIAPKGSSANPADQAAAFEPISWDEALAEIAERLHNVIDTTGPAGIWPYYGTGNMGHIQGAHGPVGDRLWNHLGVSEHNLTICSPSAHVGIGYTMGHAVGMDPEDVVHASVVLIWGANTLVSGQHWWPFVERARSNGATVIVVDPVRTRTAERADLHIAPRPGTDGALALGICKAILDRGAADLAYLEQHATGLDDFQASIKQWTLDETAATCGLELVDLQHMVEILCADSPLAVKFGHGAQRHAGGGQAARTVSCIPALLGSFTERGGGLFYSTGPQYRFNAYKATGRRPEGRPRSLVMTNLVALLETGDPPVDALIISGGNPAVSNPDTQGVRRALQREDLFTVVIDLYHTDTTDYADIVLPSAMAHEQLDLNDSFGHLYLNLNQPAAEPPGDCLAQTEIFRRLAAAMGLDDPFLFETDGEILDALLDTPDLREAGVDADYLRREGFARLPHAAKPWLPFAERFATPSGRFEFSSDRGENDGIGRLPYYDAPAEAAGPAAAATYDLIAAASDAHLNSTFAGTKVVEARTAPPKLAIHPDDAARDGLAAGDMVIVSNERGAFTIELTIDGLARPGTAVSSKGWWTTGLNNTVAERDSDMAHGAVFHDNRVTIKAIEPAV